MSLRKIKNTTTSDTYLNDWGRKHIPGFTGVISRDKFPKLFAKMKPGNSCIINLDKDYGTGGTHWTAVRMSSEAPLVMYKDSFGSPPPEDVRSAVLPLGLGLVYGNKINQKISQTNCGKHALLFLKLMEDAAEDREELETFAQIEG